MSSTVSKIVLTLSCLATAGTIGYVHYKQEYDRTKMHEGVVRDIERQQRRKIENLYLLEKQNELTRVLKQGLDK